MTTEFLSPFGFESKLLEEVTVSQLNEMYKNKCGVEIKKYFHGLNCIFLYECQGTGYKFWYPYDLAGNEDFYKSISQAWSNYYKKNRWEYNLALTYIESFNKVLEIGCGQGYFLKELEAKGIKNALGIDFNNYAIENKVTEFPIINKNLQDLSENSKFDIICLFQVLEHISNPHNFLKSVKDRLRIKGRIIVSVPNNEYSPHKLMQDAFDLPPHHLGHYNRYIIEKISEVLNMSILTIDEEKPEFNAALEEYYKKKYGFGYHFLKPYLKNKFKINNSIGHTILAVMQKNE